MNRSELISALKTKFYAVDEANIHEGATEAGITVWGVGVFDVDGDVMKKMNLTFYTKGKLDTDPAWFGVSEPKPTVVPPPPTFVQRANAYIKKQIDAGTKIKFAYIEQAQEDAAKAQGVAIDTTGVERKFLITETSTDVFSIELL